MWEDFLLKEGFEFCKFWTLDGTKLWEIFTIGDEGEIELTKEEEEKWTLGSWGLWSDIIEENCRDYVS